MILKGTFPTEKFKSLATPFYFYDITLLKETLNTVKTEAGKYGYHVHYAVKANANPRILSIIAEYGLGADCVSGGEIQAALDAGFPARKIVYAGVGKADWEINLGLDNDIFCFNVESAAESGLDRPSYQPGSRRSYTCQDHDWYEGKQIRYQFEPARTGVRFSLPSGTYQIDRHPLPYRLTNYRYGCFPWPGNPCQ